MAKWRRARWATTLAVVTGLILGGTVPAWADTAPSPEPSPSATETAAPDDRAGTGEAPTPEPAPTESPTPTPAPPSETPAPPSETTAPTPSPGPSPAPTASQPPASPSPTASPSATASPDPEPSPSAGPAPAPKPQIRSLLRAVTPMLLPGATPTASMSIQKAASTQTATPGQTFTYTIQFQCTAGTVNGCVNAELVDPLPPYLTIVSPPKVTGTANFDASASTDTQLDIVFTDDLGNGQIGLRPGNVVTVQLTVRVDPTAPVDADGQVLTNTATIDADNANAKQASANVTLDIEPTVAAGASKSFDPVSGENTTDAVTTVTIGGSNDSNVPVDELVITDPVLQDDGTPAEGGNPFELLRVVQLDSYSPPAGADTVQLRVYDSATGTWVEDPPQELTDPLPELTYPASVDPDDITGVQIVFANTDDDPIPVGASATLVADLSLREEIPEEQLPLVITNTTDTTVTTGDGESATSDPASAEYRIGSSVVNVDAGKTFDPNVVHAGDSSTVTLTGTNTDTDPLDSMTITEPAPGTINHFDNAGFVYQQSDRPVVFPTGANAGTVTFLCADEAADPLPLTNNAPLPAPPADCEPVTGFSVTFTGSIVSGATATVPFGVQTSTSQPLESWYRTNVVRVDGQRGPNSGTDSAIGVIQTITDRIAVDVAKSLYPSTIPSYPGQIVTALLTGELEPFPDSTVDAKTIVVQDPSTIPDPNQWYDSFNPRAVTSTPVPACSTLDVEYTVDGSTWLPVDGMTGIQGATIFNGAFPEDVQEDAIGIRFVYTADPAGGDCSGGFPPGTTVSPNLSYALDSDAMNEAEGTYTNCSASSGSSPTTPDATAGPACDSIDVTPVDPGSIDAVDKSWSPSTIPERSQSDTTVDIGWSTNGFTGTGRIDITDTQNPDTTPLVQSAFDSFDLISFPAITSSMDPLLTYDQITGVQLFLLEPGDDDPANGDWAPAANDPCSAGDGMGCDGVFPGFPLTADETARAIGFRFTYIESPTRASRLGDPAAPPVGSGVASSTGNGRHIQAVFRLRDDRRSDVTTPVTADQVFNVAGEDGVVRDTVRLDPYWNVSDDDPILTFTDAADILLTPVDVTVDGTKSWTGSPFGIPETGVPQSQYPTGRITVTASNTTPSKIDELVIIDPDTSDQGPASCTTSPLEDFNLIGFTTITAPADIGADEVNVHLEPGPGGVSDYSRDAALALSEAQLAGVTTMTITYTGRIDAATPSYKPTATLAFDVRLRETGRTSEVAPTTGTVCNQTHVSAADMVDFPAFLDEADAFRQAAVELVGQGIAVVADKSISPTSITEPSTGPATVTLSGRPADPADLTAAPRSRVVELQLEDSSPTFFNQYDFAGFQPVTFVAPVDQVQADVYIGGTWSIVGGAPVVTGGHWELGAPTTGTTLTLPSGVQNADVQGVRFTFTRADGANWENPGNPTQTAAFQVTRRGTLNTGGPVLPDLEQNAPAPGETAPGVATNTTTATATSSDVDAEGVPLSASDDDDATILYRHANNSVQVTKSPDGDTVSPGTPFRYTMTFTNNGSVDIENPIITERFPTDAEGPQVELTADPGFAYTMSGGTGMPTDAAEVTVVETPEQLVFTFPDGSTIPVGATYTISFEVVTRAGLPANTAFTNSVGITADRPWDACAGNLGLDPATGECRASATDTVISAGAISVDKQVKAEGSDELGVELDPLVTRRTSCAPGGDEFYSRPCVPIAEPGGDVTWRWHFTNAGNRDLDRILGIDLLPTPGDSLATAPDLQRFSQWQPVLTGARPELTNAAGGTFSVYYTTAATGWCDAPAAADDQLLCPGLNWQEWAEGASLPVDPATVTGLQIDYLPTTPLGPAETFDVDVAMVAPAYSPADTPNTSAMSDLDTFAWNTIGTAARIDGGPQAEEGEIGPAAVGDPYTLTTEPPRVGVGLAHGGFTLVKEVDGAAADQYAPDTFDVGVACTSDGEDVPLPDDVANQTLSADTPVSVYDVPWHATCTVTEGDNGQTTSDSPVSVTAQREPEQFETATLTNTYDYASLTIVKTVDSDAVDENETPIPYGPFTVEVDCTYLGEAVYADGYSADEPMVEEIADGAQLTFTGLPAGASCIVSETDDKGAVSTTITTTVGDGDPTTTDGTTSDPIELAPDTDDGDPANAVEIVNAFAVGAIALVKDVTGDVADIYGAGPFVVHVECTLDDETGLRPTYTGDVTLGGGAPLSAEIVNIAAGSECVLEETDDGGASSTSIEPEGPISVDAGETATVTVVNSFDPASIFVDKEVDGDAAAFAPDSFPIAVTCSANDAVLPGFPVTVDVTPGTPVEIPTLAGSTCSAIELDTGEATEVTYDPPAADGGEGSGTVVAEDAENPPTITVTNTYRSGALRIVKLLRGEGAAAANGPFVFSVVCAFNGDEEAYAGTVTLRRIGPSNTLTSDLIEPLPIGAECTVAETDDGGADSTPDPVTVTIPDPIAGAATVAVATLVNTFAPLAVTGGTAPPWWIVIVAVLLVAAGLISVVTLRLRRRG